MFKCFSLVVVAVSLSGCMGSTATVVSPAGGQRIDQVQAAPYNGPQKRIAVTNFSGLASPELSRGMKDMMTDALFNSGRFIVLERDHINEVMDEQDLSNSRRFKKETAAPIGELEGAQLLVRGSITKFEPNCSGGSVILVSAKKACMTLNIRILDAKTGRVVNATTVEGTSSNAGVGLVFAGGTLPVGLGAYSKTPMEDAIRQCIEAAVQHIVDTKL